MVSLTIDEREVEVKEGATILEAAEHLGIKIPTLCHDKRLVPYGACRMCIVEERERKGRFIPACFTPVKNGMDIITDSAEIRKSRRKKLEFMLLNHPMDCPTCDKRGDCALQALVYEYGLEDRIYPWEKITFPVDHVSPFIQRDPNKCILCGKCVRICNEVQGIGALGFVDRGLHTRIGTSYDRVLDCEFCGQCIDVCPVGALTSNLFDYEARWWELKETATICGFCSCGCTLMIGCKEGKIRRIEADPDRGINEGVLCVKGRFGWEYVHSPQRLTTPLIRKNDTLSEVSWEEALSFASQRLKQLKTAFGSECIAGIASERLTNEECYLFQKFMRAALSTNHIDHAGGYGYAGLLGLKESLGYAATTNSVSEIREADVIILLRCNISETHPLVRNELNYALRDANPQLIIASSLGLELKRPAGSSPLRKPPLSLLHRPGTEVVLLNGMIQVVMTKGLIDEQFVFSHTEGIEELKEGVAKHTPAYVEDITGVNSKLLENAAIAYAQGEESVVLMGSGLGFMGDEKGLALATSNLALVAGKLGKKGNGIYFLGEKCNSQGALDMGLTPNFLPGYQEVRDTKGRKKFETFWGTELPTHEGLGALEILRGVEDGRIKALYLVGANPLVTYPSYFQTIKSLKALDFLLVQDLFITETAKLADVVLPASSFAEKEGTYTNIERRIQKLDRAIPAPGNSRSDYTIFIELSHLLEYNMDYASPAEVMKEISQLVPLYGGVHYERLGDSGLQWPCKDLNHAGTQYLYKDGFTGKKAKIVSVGYEALGGIDADYPFILLTGGLLFHSGSLSLMSSGLKKICPENYLEMNREDAQRLNLVEGEDVLVKSKNGEVAVRCKVSKRPVPSVVFMPCHFSPGVNVLTNRELGLTKVRVEKKKG